MKRAVMFLLAGMVIAPSARAQEEAVRTIPFEGPEVFCHILKHEGLQPVATIEAVMDDPKQTMVIVFGSLGRSGLIPRVFDRLRRFESEGGNTLIATDREYAFSYRQITITGRTLPPANPDRAYRHHSSCPMISVAEGRGHPIFQLLHKPIATNCPSYLEIAEPARKAMYLVPYETHGAWHDRRDRWFLAASPKSSPPEGRTLFIAGHGLFMNGMMIQSDNDNFAFAINGVRWLREGPNGKPRTRAMFIVDGRVITNFDASLTPPPMVPMPPIKAIDRLLHGLEKERFFHRILDRIVGENVNALLSVLFAAVTFLVLLYGAKKLLEGRYQLETAVPRMVGAVVTLGPAVAVIKQRQVALFRQTNLGSEARLLARAWLRQEFGIEAEQWTADARMKIEVIGWFWGRRSVWRQSERVLQLAISADAAPMTRRQFAGLLRTLSELSAARRGGRLALQVEGKTVRLDSF